MNKLIASIALTATGLLVTSVDITSAATVANFTVIPSTINVGQNADLELILTLQPDVVNFAGPPYAESLTYTGGSVTIFAGDGASQIFNISSASTVQTFDFNHVFSTPGPYTPNYTFQTTYEFSYTTDLPSTYPVFIDYRYEPNYNNALGCGQDTCLVPYYAYETVPYTFVSDSSDSGQGSGTLNVNAALIATTPLPAALPLFASGLGALGLLGWRRKRKAQATA